MGAPDEIGAILHDWADRRKRAGWALDTTRMAKSGYAPKKAELARWVAEAADEIERLSDRLTRIETMLRIAKVGRDSRPQESLTPNEQMARHGQDTILAFVEEALSVE